LQRTQQYLLHEQRGLRFYIRGLRSSPLWVDNTPGGLNAYLQELAARARSIWDMELVSEIEKMDEIPASTPMRDIYRIVQEGVINAARHGDATEVHLKVTGGERSVNIAIADNGRGFPSDGAKIDSNPTQTVGSVTLHERVRTLGGTLAVRSDDSGAEVEINLPLQHRP
jgi:signal transduction histidine kinase